MSGNTSRPFIVVGVDGSQSSKDALRWATRQAGLTGADLHAITAWQIPAMAYPYPVFIDADVSEDAAKMLDATVEEALGSQPAIAVTTQAVMGHPAVVLLDAAAGADLLVVGSRGHGAFTGMLLGSVSQHCVHHSPCPVVVIRHLDQTP